MHNCKSLNGLNRQLIVLRMDLRINVFEELTGKSIYQFESQTFCCCHVVGLLKIIISPFMLKKPLLGKRHFQLWSYRWLFKWVRTVLKHVFFPKSFIPADNSRQQAGHCCRKCVELFVRKVETLRKLTNKTYEHFVWWIPSYAKWRDLRCESRTYEHFCSYESLVNTAPGLPSTCSLSVNDISFCCSWEASE